MNWIKVENRLPDVGERVIFSTEGFVGEGYISSDKNWYRINTPYNVEDVLGRVLAWCDMPESYEEE